MDKTKPSYKETKFGILPIQEIENLISINLITVRSYILRNYKKLTISIDLAKELHSKLAENIFNEAGNFRKTEVTIGNYKPPKNYKLLELMTNWQDDLQERIKHIKNKNDHIQTLSWLMHKFLWIHPFFDYNGRICRLLGEIYLLQNNLPVISFMGIKRNDFSNAMKSATFENNFTKIENLIKNNLKN